MNKSIKDIFCEHPSFQQFISFLDNSNEKNAFLKNIQNSPLAILTAAIYDKIKRKILIISGENDAAYLYNDMLNFVSEEELFLFPTSYKKSNLFDKQDTSKIVLRYQCLFHLITSDKPCIIITFTEAIAKKSPKKESFQKNIITLTHNKKFSREDLSALLFKQEFQLVDFVEKPGQFSIRGSIFDIFSFSELSPYRIDFFGDIINSIRIFSTDSQLSIKNIQSCNIISNIFNENTDENGFLTDYLSNDTVLLKYHPLKFNSSKIKNHFLQFFPKIITWGLSHRSQQFDKILNFNQKSLTSFNKNFQLLADTLHTNEEMGYKNLIFSNNSHQIKRLQHILNNTPTSVKFTALNYSIHKGFIDEDLKICCLTEHQIFDKYHKPRLKHLKLKHVQQNNHIKKLTELQIGDYVVHIDHGIGRFEGLQKIENNGRTQEAICISYLDNDLLFVNSHSLYKISNYKSKDGIEPKIYKLGSPSWQKLKQKTKSKVKDIAKDLIYLYAKRKKIKGFSYSADTYLQEELEASFIYEDTLDQIKATKDIKTDMELPNPMDRLLCGDVGFGKTEIAIRVAFKAVTDSKQVVVLVPTTVLAFQHFNTFTNRLKDFPCNVEYLSRFRSRNEQKQIIENLSTGRIDIIIGTHRVISKDIKFKELGLLIIDEEQKFGVSIKEKLKQLKTSVDTLTLTATPIPRTLQFSLIGVRDLSIMQTPPKNRYPVTTEIHNFNEEIIRKAILYEVNRGGQVFFIHNRVHNIYNVKDIIDKILPNIKTKVVHGQMSGIKLEKNILRFMNGEIDVLISTSIIETGMDIPNANTIIIHQAHTFGLSDLYQLRGRVGRSTVHAYCYLLIPPLHFLTKKAIERLKTIEEFSDLGSGFNIAMKDLDIRGAGNLLGGEQSGFIMDIGYETYQKILNEAIHELQTNEFKNIYNKSFTSNQYVVDCQIKTDFEAYIPDNYIENPSERIAVYRQINLLQNEKQIKNLQSELLDKFGEIPVAIDTLINIVRLRWLAIKVGLEYIFLQDHKLIGYFPKSKEHPFFQSKTFEDILSFVQEQKYSAFLEEKKNKLSIIINEIPSIEIALHAVSSLAITEKEPN